MQKPINIAIDASNIRSGGGLTHLSRLLQFAIPEEQRVKRVFVWGGRHTLAELPEKKWLQKVHVPMLDCLLPIRVLWQQAVLPIRVRQNSCDILFSPGGTVPVISPVPVVTMSQNMLPFESAEAARYPLGSPFRTKLSILRRVQSFSMRHAAGIIFLTRYAKESILPAILGFKGKTVTVPHGIENRFFCEPREGLSIEAYSTTKPFRIKYVSTIDDYKHQIEVAVAVAAVRAKGFPVELQLVGSARQSYLRKLESKLKNLDPSGEFLRYSGNIVFARLHEVYQEANLFIFASSCENLPNILLEAMASGVPIVSSNKGPMPEVLGSAGMYFNPESPSEIADAITAMIESTALRAKSASEAYLLAKVYSWESCSADTLSFIWSVFESSNTGMIN